MGISQGSCRGPIEAVRGQEAHTQWVSELSATARGRAVTSTLSSAKLSQVKVQKDSVPGEQASEASWKVQHSVWALKARINSDSWEDGVYRSSGTVAGEQQRVKVQMGKLSSWGQSLSAVKKTKRSM